MTASNQQLVSGLLAKVGGGRHGGSSGDLAAAEVRVDVDPEDVERKSWQALEKKGFDADAVGRALRETEPSVAAEGDRREAFNEQKRRRTHRALDWLILNLDEGELPETFHEEARTQRKRRGAAAGKKKAANDSVEDEMDPTATRVAEALRAAGSRRPSRSPPPPRRMATSGARWTTSAPRSGRAERRRSRRHGRRSRRRVRGTSTRKRRRRFCGPRA